MAEKLLFTGKTHNTGGRNGGTRSSDGQLDLRLTQPHPAAENLFGAAWSACFIARSNSPLTRERSSLQPAPRSMPQSISTSITAPISCGHA
ncbi:organic hydroperoxide reductase OsmC/OhrA [Sinorhizobium fredii]|nr:Organic hydroperoxide resistance protein [Sinorhizobium fredii CCBAU 25509]